MKPITYLEALEQVERENRKNALTNAVAAGFQTPADAYAKALQIGGELAPSVVARNLDEMQRRHEQSQFVAAAAGTSWEDFFLRRPDAVSLFRDDMESMTALDTVTAFVRGGLAGAYDLVNTAPANVVRAGVRQVDATYDAIGAARDMLGLSKVPGLPNPFDPDTGALGQFMEREAATLRATSDWIAGDAVFHDNFSAGVYSGVRSAGMNIGALAAGIATQNPAVALSMMSASAGALKYEQALDDGYSHTQALTSGLSEAGIEAVTETLAVGQLFKDLNAASPLWKTLANQLVFEGFGEQAATLLQDFADWVQLHPEKTAAEFAAERPDAAVQTLVATVVGTALQTGVAHIGQRVAERLQPEYKRSLDAKRAYDLMARLMQITEASKARQRAPQVVQEYLEGRTEGLDDLYFDGEELAQVIEEQGAELPPELRAEIMDAALTGNDVRIPVSTFAAQMSGQPYADVLLQVARYGADGMSIREAETFDQQQVARIEQEAQSLLEEVQTRVDSATDFEFVHNSVVEQLTAIGQTQQIANINGSLLSAYYATTAKRLGMGVRAFVEEYGLERIRSERSPSQPVNNELDASMEAGGRPISLRPQQPDALTLTGIHYSQAADPLTLLEGARSGSGIKGAEQTRLQESSDERIRRRAYFYVPRENGQFQRPEAGLGQQVVAQHFANIAPPERISEILAQIREQSPDLTPAERMNAMESAIIDAGYDGYSNAGVLVILDADVPVRSLGTRADVGIIRDPARVDQMFPSLMPMPGRFFSMSAELWNLPPEENAARMNEMERRLTEAGVPYKRIKGAYKGTPEQSFVVDARSPQVRAVAEQIAFQGFGQESVLDVSPTGAAALKYGTGEIEPLPGLYSQVDSIEGLDAYSIIDGKIYSVVQPPGEMDQRIPGSTDADTIFPLDDDGVEAYLTDRDIEEVGSEKQLAKAIEIFNNPPQIGPEGLADMAQLGQAMRGWYSEASRVIRWIFGEADAPRFAALMASLSPQTSVAVNFDNAIRVWVEYTKWMRENKRRPNVKEAKQILADGLGTKITAEGNPTKPLGAWVNNVVRSLVTENVADIKLSGPKVSSFTENLLGGLYAVTLDAWMANVLGIDQDIFSGRATYEFDVLNPYSQEAVDAAGGKKTKLQESQSLVGVIDYNYAGFSAMFRKAADILTARTGEFWTPAEIQETVWSWGKSLIEQLEPNQRRRLPLADRISDDKPAFETAMSAEFQELLKKTPDMATMFRNEATSAMLREVPEYAEALDTLYLVRNDFGTGADLTDQEREALLKKEGPRSITERIDRVRAEYAQKKLKRGSDGNRSVSAALAELSQQGGVSGGAGSLEVQDAPLAGLPATVKVNGEDVAVRPHLPARELARRYVESQGREYVPIREYVPVDEARARRIAGAYDAMAHDPQNPEVRRAYDAMVEETLAQYQLIKESGLTVEFIDISQGDPYAGSPRLAIQDVVENNHMWVFSTRDGFGQEAITEEDIANNPMLQETGETISGQPALVNDIFRVVHDYFGHVKEGNGFRANGEETAWRSHATMYSPLARRAMTTETRGQNSWVNYGPHGDSNRTAASEDTVYAEQKVGLLPEWVSEEGLYSEAELNQEEQPTRTLGRRGYIRLSDTSLAPRMEIVLTDKVNLSTFLHEAGHYFLETTMIIASRTGAPQELVDDANVFLRYVGFKGTALDWMQTPLAQRKTMHEKFAESFEKWLYEGDAPSRQLQPLFAKFRSWLMTIYKTITEGGIFGGVRSHQLSPEVRAAMSRLLATREEIDAKIDINGLAPLFADQQTMGVSDTEWEAYRNAIAVSVEDAHTYLQRQSMSTAKWTREEHGRVLRRLQAEQRAKRRALRRTAEAEVRGRPERLAERLIVQGKGRMRGPDGNMREIDLTGVPHRLNRDAVARYNIELPDKFLTAGEGMTPEELSVMVGARSTRVLLASLARLQPVKEDIEAEIDRLMVEKYGKEQTPAAMAREADRAVHNAARQRFVAAEYRALRRAMKAQGSDPTKEPSLRALQQMAKLYAERKIARIKLTKVNPAEFSRAEARAARVAAQAMEEGNVSRAAAAKRNQLLNGYAARYAADARAKAERDVRYLRKFVTGKVNPKRIDPDYREQIVAILENYDLAPRSNVQLDKREALRAWIEKERAKGNEPVFSDAILAARKNFRELTVEEFNGLVDAVRNIHALGKLKNKLLRAQEKRTLDELGAQGRQSLQDNAPTIGRKRAKNPRGLPAGKLDSASRVISEFFASHRKLASYLREWDGVKDNGFFWRVIGQPMNDAGNYEATKNVEATRKIIELLKPITGEGQESMRSKRVIPGAEAAGELTREQRLVIALNWGNETNRRRLMDNGIERGQPLGEETLVAIVHSLSKAEMDFVQGVWDYLDSYWPEIAAKARRTTGVAPKRVKPLPIMTPHGEYRGGYFPIKYDPSQSSAAELDDQRNLDERAAARGLYSDAMTRHGHEKERVNVVTDRPMLLDFSVLTGHLQQVIHDLAYHEWLIDTGKILKRVEPTIRELYGDRVMKQVTSALSDIAAGDQGARTSMERIFNHLRVGSTIVGLGVNFGTAALQPLGLSQTIVRVGPVWMTKGMARYLRNPMKASKEVFEKSKMMQTRALTINREINEIRNKVHDRKSIDSAYFWLISRTQMFGADVPTWLAQYEKSAAAGVTDEAELIALADQAVLDSQGGGQIKDLAQVQRGSPLFKLFTNFYSYFNLLYNLTAEAGAKARRGNVIGALSDFFLLSVVPAVLSKMLMDALKGEDDEDEDYISPIDPRNIIAYHLGSIVLVRELTGVVMGYPYRGPASLRFFTSAAQLVDQTLQGEADEAWWRALNNTAGTVLHYPAGQVERTVAGIIAMSEGNAGAPAILFGPPPEE